MGFSLVVASGGYSLVVRGRLIAVASSCGAPALVLRLADSVVPAPGF